VMRHFPAPLTRAQSDAMVQRIGEHFARLGFGLWTLEVQDADFSGFVGFVGLTSSVPFELPLPGIVARPHEIGWRLARHAWGRGLASEAAAPALRHAFDALALLQVVSFTALGNTASQAVMRRIGLTFRGECEHPGLPAGHALRRHVLYAIDRPAA
jgi:RimJ/RimL family protein N-acetyltransferase